jgi:hypothetical protein
MKYFGILKKALEKTKQEHKIKTASSDFPDIVYKIIQVSLDILDQDLFDRLTKVECKILIKNEIVKFEDHDKLLASANFRDNTIDLHIDKNQLDNNNYLVQIIHSILHEIGHLVFYAALDVCKVEEVLKNNVLKFFEVCNTYKSFSPLAEKYLKEVYGKQIRENNLHMIRGVDIKYHECFAEMFRIYHVHKLDKLLDPKIQISVPKELLETYENIYSCLHS